MSVLGETRLATSRSNLPLHTDVLDHSMESMPEGTVSASQPARHRVVLWTSADDSRIPTTLLRLSRRPLSVHLDLRAWTLQLLAVSGCARHAVLICLIRGRNHQESQVHYMS